MNHNEYLFKWLKHKSKEELLIEEQKCIDAYKRFRHNYINEGTLICNLEFKFEHSFKSIVGEKYHFIEYKNYIIVFSKFNPLIDDCNIHTFIKGVNAFGVEHKKISDYFYTEKEYRKQKLKQLNK